MRASGGKWIAQELSEVIADDLRRDRDSDTYYQRWSDEPGKVLPVVEDGAFVGIIDERFASELAKPTDPDSEELQEHEKKALTSSLDDCGEPGKVSEVLVEPRYRWLREICDRTSRDHSGKGKRKPVPSAEEMQHAERWLEEAGVLSGERRLDTRCLAISSAAWSPSPATPCRRTAPRSTR